MAFLGDIADIAVKGVLRCVYAQLVATCSVRWLDVCSCPEAYRLI